MIPGVNWLISGGALFGFYLLLAGKVSGPELLIGAVAATLGVVAVGVPRRSPGVYVRPRLVCISRLGKLAVRVLADCGIVGWALVRRLIAREAVQGAFRTIPFDPGEDDPADAVRRALVTAGISLAPNTYVVDIVPEEGTILVHQLVPTPEPPGHGDRRWPL